MAFLSCEEMLAAPAARKFRWRSGAAQRFGAKSRLTEAHSRAMRHLWQVMRATSQEYDPGAAQPQRPFRR